MHKRIPLLVTAWLLAMPVTGAQRARSDDVPRLLEIYKCTLCHAENAAKAGPAFVDVARHYRGKPGALQHVAAVIRAGQHGGGPWHMPPHPEVSREEATEIARYILSLR